MISIKKSYEKKMFSPWFPCNKLIFCDLDYFLMEFMERLRVIIGTTYL